MAERTRDAGIAARTCDEGRTVVIANAVAIDVPQARLDGDPPRVVAVGRLKEPKDFITLVAALRQVDTRYRAAIIGAVPDRSSLEALAAAPTVQLLRQRPDLPAHPQASADFALAILPHGTPLSRL